MFKSHDANRSHSATYVVCERVKFNYEKADTAPMSTKHKWNSYAHRVIEKSRKAFKMPLRPR